MTAPQWGSRVICAHEAALGQASTLAAWPTDGCPEVDRLGHWEVGVRTAEPIATSMVLDALRRTPTGLTIAEALARLTREPLPRCSVLLADGEYAGGLAWGEPLGLSDLGGWEFSLATRPAERRAWRPMVPGTIVSLDACGPTVFTVDFPEGEL